MVPPGAPGNPYPGGASGGVSAPGRGRESRMARKASVPDVPERPECPINVPLVFRLGAGERTFDTDYGSRPAFGVHVFDVSGPSAEYVGHVNLFWDAVRAQLGEALTDADVLLPAFVVKQGRRYELRPFDTEAREDAAIASVEALIASDEWSDSAEDSGPDDAPF